MKHFYLKLLFQYSYFGCMYSSIARRIPLFHVLESLGLIVCWCVQKLLMCACSSASLHSTAGANSGKSQISAIRRRAFFIGILSFVGNNSVCHNSQVGWNSVWGYYTHVKLHVLNPGISDSDFRMPTTM